jgi:hypothetical protein
MPSIGQTWVLASIGAVVEMGVLSTLKNGRIEYIETTAVMESMHKVAKFMKNLDV